MQAYLVHIGSGVLASKYAQSSHQGVNCMKLGISIYILHLHLHILYFNVGQVIHSVWSKNFTITQFSSWQKRSSRKFCRILPCGLMWNSFTTLKINASKSLKDKVNYPNWPTNLYKLYRFNITNWLIKNIQLFLIAPIYSHRIWQNFVENKTIEDK